MAGKYRDGMEGRQESEGRDENPEMSRRRMLAYAFGAGAAGAGIYYGLPELARQNPRKMEQFFNNIMR